MPHELRPSEEASGVGSDEPRQPDFDAEGEASPPARVIPGNVGSLDDVPTEWVEEGVLTVDDEGT
ncbi:MAG: hypothetical protein M3R02_07080 [Chloroflexota bacterium]|nr:hypothetical protein [Chloroflexota bacterium]